MLPTLALAFAVAAPPNVVVLLADDLGYADLGSYADTPWKTPHLNQLARDGVRFTNFTVSQPVCSASRASLLTGCYANRLGIHNALGPQNLHGLNAKETTLAAMLKARGYATAIFGKWHLGHLPQHLPTRHGFDTFAGLPYSNDMWPRHPESKFPPLPFFEDERIANAGVTAEVQGTLTQTATDRAVRFIRANAEKPFFLYVPYSMPHVPLFAGAKFRGRTASVYGDVVEEIDASVGTIRATLAELKLTANTLVLFASDNGPWLSYGNHAGRAGGLREGKGTVFEGGVRVPCLASLPGVTPAGGVQHEPAMTIDVLPTVAALCGAKLPELPIDGKDIAPLLRCDAGAKSPHAAYFFYYGVNELQAVRAGKWKLMLAHTARTMDGQPPGKDGVPGKYKALPVPQTLYDLEADPGETTDASAKYPAELATMLAHAERARAELGDRLTTRTGAGSREAGK